MSHLGGPLINVLNCGKDPENIELALFQSCIIWSHELLICLNSKLVAINNQLFSKKKKSRLRKHLIYAYEPVIK